MSEEKHAHTPVFNTQPTGLEKWLDETNRKLSFQLPEEGRKWIANNVWWLTLIGGILSLWGAWGFWQLGHTVSSWGRWAEEVGRAYGVDTAGTSSLGVTWYLALAVMLVQGVLLLVAFQQLKEHKKSGWNLLFYSSLLSVLLGFVYIFVPGYGAANLIGWVIGAVISWFFLFQIRKYFVK